MKTWHVIVLIGIILATLYLVGPNPKTPVYNAELQEISADSKSLDQYVKAKENLHKVKPDNEARIVWANDSLKQKTKYSIVYLHGFSASQEEGNPVHRKIAKAFGCNLYLSRLAYHGIDTSEAMQNLTVYDLWESAKEAFAIGKLLGDTVILMGTSTGGTLNLLLATQHPEIKGLINLSANIRINNPSAWILNNPWGLQVARIVSKGDYFIAANETEAFKKYWYDTYRLEALTQLEELLESSMNEPTFKRVKIPVLNLYYYKSETEKDDIVRVDKIIEMHKALGTPESLKVAKAIPTACNHVLGSPIKSRDIETVNNEIENFIINKLGISKPI